jgi:hypothetical protein
VGAKFGTLYNRIETLLTDAIMKQVSAAILYNVPLAPSFQQEEIS